MIRGFDFPRGDGNEITATLVVYKNILMTRAAFEEICKVEDLATSLLARARSDMSELVSIVIKHP